ncbi:MAG TPA: polysaccharide biosynthesis/export family protein [Desulfomonilaceae bacterium]|nr:polysaccharide biosynthesis/export family protein [Desulfomonilaceae bacterium]
MKKYLSYRFVVAALLTLLLGGCIGLVPSPFRPSPGPQKTPQVNDLAEAFDVVCRNYRLGPNDQLVVLFQTEWNIPVGSYKLDTLDQIKIKFILDPQLNEDVVIRPDGMITLQAIGEIRAAGLTPDQLAKRIEEKFLEANIFTKEEARRGESRRYQLVTVHVASFYEKVKKLVESLTTLTRGSQLGVPVKPDGTIDLPLIRDRVFCAGHTVPEVENTVNKLYRDGVLEHVVVSMALGAANSRKVYVMGQVGSPGAFSIDQPITAFHALALAGGATETTADLTSVILISKDIYGKPIGRRLDLKKILDVGDMSSAIMVKPYDVLYVPKTYITDVTIFVQQYLNTILDFKAFANALRQ